MEKRIVDGEVITDCVVDPETSQVVESIVAMIEQGHGCAPISRTLNEQGHRSQRGNPWKAATVRQVARNRAYKGEAGYPVLIDPDRWENVQRLLGDSTPVTSGRRSGGRPVERGFLLHGLAFCGVCGAPMRVRTDNQSYVCRNVRQGTGLCHARGIKATLADERVMQHLHVFIDSVADWITERSRSGTRNARPARGLWIVSGPSSTV